MIELDANAGDDPAFLAFASRLIVGAAVAGRTREITTVHIDHWFGERWLGFRGKMLGVAGVRSRRLRGELGVPPFHPNRVHSTLTYQFQIESQRFEPGGGGWSIHGKRTSEENLNRSLWPNGLFAWYSGDTVETRKGVVMVYVIDRPRSIVGWYASFERKPEWGLTKSVGIAPQRIAELMGMASPLSAS